jgi:hypothetical protein
MYCKLLATLGCNQTHKLWLGQSARQFPQKFLLVHAVLECFAAVDEDDGDLVVILAAEFGIGVNIHIAPLKTATLMEFDEALLDDFAEMTPLAGIDDDFPVLHNSGSVAGWNPVSKP